MDLPWMRPEAPYMPVATAGLLLALRDAGRQPLAWWNPTDTGPVLRFSALGGLDHADVAQVIAEVELPSPKAIAWDQPLGQAIKPMLATRADPLAELARLRSWAEAEERRLEHRLLSAFLTDAVKDDKRSPGRNRLLRGVKSDLSGIADKVPADPEALAAELAQGPRWLNKYSGRALGLVPEVQTFGGTTGRTPSDVGSHSRLLFRLLWLGVLALPPVGVVRRGRRVVGGPLVTEPGVLSWPVWTCGVDLVGLRALFSLASVHDSLPNSHELSARNISAVYRVRGVPINTNVDVFPWAERVA